MNIATQFAALVMQQVSGGGGPDAAPSNPTEFCYSGDNVGLGWTNGDSDAGTQILQDGSLIATVSPGVSTYETGLRDSAFQASSWSARHILNRQTSAAITFDNTHSCGGGAV